jgi:hypothetical protein
MSNTSSTLQSTNQSFSSQLRDQWSNPGEILSVLLIVGADVIQKALAQFNGQTFKPVAFSFGWVAYAYSYLLQTVGRLKSTPDPDFPSYLINCGSGKIWERSSWLLGRILRHYDLWIDRSTSRFTDELLHWKWAELQSREGVGSIIKVPKPERSGLVVAVYEPSPSGTQGVPDRARGILEGDRVLLTGVIVTVIQLGIAAIPCGLYGEWEVLLLTACGTLLSWLMGLLQEQSAQTRKKTGKTFALTQGIGSQHVIIILGNDNGIDLEDLASEVFRDTDQSALAITYAFAMVALWTALLVTTSGIKSNTWYLFAIGGIGMIQNIYVAGAARRPSAYGIHLVYKDCIGEPKVMNTLLEVERRYPRVGRSLLPLFFSGALRSDETDKWNELEDLANANHQVHQHHSTAKTLNVF